MNREQESALSFPCHFPIKAMGPAGESFQPTVLEIIRRHVAALAEGDIALRSSSGGKYLSLTVTIEATSREQLDAIYRDLHACDLVLMAL